VNFLAGNDIAEYPAIGQDGGSGVITGGFNAEYDVVHCTSFFAEGKKMNFNGLILARPQKYRIAH
jgi:hypothetical protein